MADLLRDYGDRWTFEPVTIGSPAVATGFTKRVAGSDVWRVLSVSFVLVADGNAAAHIGGPLPDLILMDGLAVRVAVTAIQAGDQLSGISLFVAQSTVRPGERGE